MGKIIIHNYGRKNEYFRDIIIYQTTVV